MDCDSSITEKSILVMIDPRPTLACVAYAKQTHTGLES